MGRRRSPGAGSSAEQEAEGQRAWVAEPGARGSPPGFRPAASAGATCDSVSQQVRDPWSLRAAGRVGRRLCSKHVAAAWCALCRGRRNSGQDASQPQVVGDMFRPRSARAWRASEAATPLAVGTPRRTGWPVARPAPPWPASATPADHVRPTTRPVPVHRDPAGPVSVPAATNLVGRDLDLGPGGQPSAFSWGGEGPSSWSAVPCSRQGGLLMAVQKTRTCPARSGPAGYRRPAPGRELHGGEGDRSHRVGFPSTSVEV